MCATDFVHVLKKNVLSVYVVVSRATAMDGHHEQENTLNQLLVEMDGKSRQGSTKCTPESQWRV